MSATDTPAPGPRVTDAPEAVWLVYGDLERDATHRECCASGEVTWCEDAQFPADVRYLRADLLYQQAREIAAQEVAAERERIADLARSRPGWFASFADCDDFAERVLRGPNVRAKRPAGGGSAA